MTSTAVQARSRVAMQQDALQHMRRHFLIILTKNATAAAAAKLATTRKLRGLC